MPPEPSQPPAGWPTWGAAMRAALYGEHGFYRGGGPVAVPRAHFRTSVHASPAFAEGLLTLARACGARAVVDVGSGGGELLAALHGLAPDLTLLGVEVADRPAGLPARIGWQHDLPPTVSQALVVANEWLDNVPVDVAVPTAEGPRLLRVDPSTGAEAAGPVPDADQRAWLDRWWPTGVAGQRAEVGLLRDRAWQDVVRRLEGSVAVAVDYAHTAGDRPHTGTLTGYRAGRQVPPVPDGSCDITAHVALDAVAAAGLAAGAGWSVLTTQREALGTLIGPPPRTTYDDARGDPAGHLAALARAGELAELRAAGGLGGFGWLVQGVGVPVPEPLRRLAADR